MKILLSVEKGKKTWCGKIIDQELKLDFIVDSNWSKDRQGVLEFKIKDTGYYMAQSSNDRKFYEVTQDEKGELQKKEVTKSDAINSFVFVELSQNSKRKDFDFSIIKLATKNTTWDLEYQSMEDCYISENEHYYMISGKFLKISQQYIRNFSKIQNFSKKEVVLKNEIFSKKNDNIKIVFRDDCRAELTCPVPENTTIKTVHRLILHPLKQVDSSSII